ncbi:MAG: DUF456 domain-containing protein [Flavobacteriales bacterium]|nr:DUF456 domain-containing protein [Flavobacteriales bacterium]
MDVLILIGSVVLLLLGLAGCIVPGLPGPPIAWIALPLLRLHSNTEIHPENNTLLIYGFAVLLITVLDYYLPIWGTRRYGGTNAGKRGSIVGLILGLFVPVFGPLTIILGPFAGAVIGELIGGSDEHTAWRSGLGTFIGFMAGTLIKIAICFLIIAKFVGLLFI